MARFSLSPRAAVVIAVAIVVLTVGVLVVSRLSTVPGVTTVDGALPLASDGVAESSSARVPRSSVTAEPTSSAPASAGTLIVDVVGAVTSVGVVRVHAGDRVMDAIAAAGGAVAQADLTRLNLARQVQDGERIYVPSAGETEIPAVLDGGASTSGAAAGSSAANAGTPVNLNTADAAQLQTLPGIGAGLAERIIAWREQHGPFSSVDGLLDVSGIGDARLASLQDLVTVG